MVKFPISQKEHEFELSYGSYNVYLSGGFGIENIESLDIHLVNESGETITLKEKSLKTRDIIGGERVIKCYSFDVYSFSKYKLRIENPEIISIRKNYNSPLGIGNLFRRNNESTNINVIIK